MEENLSMEEFWEKYLNAEKNAKLFASKDAECFPFGSSSNNLRKLVEAPNKLKALKLL